MPFEPEILERIENVYLSGTKTSDSLMLFHAVTFGDVVTMRVNEPGSGKRTVACFTECLKAEGIRYEFRRVPDHGFMRYMPEIWE